MSKYSSRKRGTAAEAVVKQALELLQERSELISFEQSKPNSGLDKDGIDFTLQVTEREEFFIQVKSGEAHRGKFLRSRRGKSRFGFVPVVLARPEDEIPIVTHRIKCCIELLRSRAKRMKNEEALRQKKQDARRKDRFNNRPKFSMVH